MIEHEIISICKGLSCRAAGSEEIHDLLEQEANIQGLKVDIVSSCCKGFCEKGANVTFLNSQQILNYLSPRKVKEILKKLEELK